MGGGIAANSIARWDGTTWSALGLGIGTGIPYHYDYVFALAVNGEELTAGGRFAIAGGDSAKCIARWDGAHWSPIGSGLNDEVWALAVYDRALVAGGYFTIAGGVPSNYIARWDGAEWSPFGSGLNDEVYSLTVTSDDLYVGGEFLTAGNKPSWHIARWMRSFSNVRDPASPESPLMSAPNPYRPGQPIALAPAQKGQGKVAIYGVNGRRIRTLFPYVNGEGWRIVTWDGRTDLGTEAGAGVYYVRAQSGTAHSQRRIVLLK